jgi:hypothetical protein
LGFNVAVAAPESDDPKSDPTYPVLWGGVVMARNNYLLGLRPVPRRLIVSMKIVWDSTT